MHDPPAGLRTAGLKLWADTHEGVAPGWKLDVADLELLEQACRLKDTAVRLQRRVDHEGTTVQGSEGQMVAHPLLREVRMTRALVVATLKKVEIAPPRARTAHLDKRGRDQLRDARARRWEK
jgi:hypothetical protein